jgi:hypothetical protein
VNGYEGATTGQVFGVSGGTNSTTQNAAGVNGWEGAATGRVFGVNGGTNSTTQGAAAVNGWENAATGGVNGVSGGTNSTGPYAAGVNAFEGATTGVNWGVNATSASPQGIGVQGSSPGTGISAWSQSCGSSGCAMTAGTAGFFATGSGGYLLRGLSGPTGTTPPTLNQVFSVDASGNGYFNGNLQVKGTLSKGGGSFKIDDPLDPAHKYLSHSFVESPDMMNVYNGVAVLDAHGSAWVTLPDYFEALNRDFRYQLTAVGAPGPNLYIAKKVSGNRFKIAGGKPHGEVSWQVTGIRHDAYADAYRIPVEEEKPPQEQGHYLHPELFGASEHQAIGAAVSVPSTGVASPTRASTMNLPTEDGGAVK